ncbi:MAG TPA: hypothetical protein VGS27_20805 [Candidatus Sulfotelmatobacter sp.]|nr:hypothetical protein [Candidatus Sulfotelmatobacter sp.]
MRGMPVPGPDEKQHDVLEFIREYIDTVPELEALLLLWEQRPSPWSIEDLAQRLYIGTEETRTILLDLKGKGLISAALGDSESFQYDLVSEQRNDLMCRTEELYRRQIVRISTMIHSKPSSAVRDFARAFRFKKEK